MRNSTISKPVMPSAAAMRLVLSPMVRRIEAEAMTLLIEARSYFEATLASRPSSPEAGVKPLVESGLRMLVTDRLVWVMSWVLFHKAVANEEITSEEATAEMMDIFRRRGEPLADMADAETAPPQLRSLLDRSDHLIGRVERLLLVAEEGIAAAQG